jgi:Icc-related predicted phosphoesterase
VRVAAVADLHVRADDVERVRRMFATVKDEADVLVLAGDLTDHGRPGETEALVRGLHHVGVPVVAVLGNHDHEAGNERDMLRILGSYGIHILDRRRPTTTIAGVGFAGVKGFGGGFGRRTLEPWGEEATKAFVQEAVTESLKLESALARLRTPQRVAVLHYAPIEATVEGEPREIFPFLGSSRLEEPINRYRAAAVFHGHAHRGSPEGVTSAGIPVYNVAMPLLRRAVSEQLPLKIVEVAVPEAVAQDQAPPSRRHDDPT